MSKVGKILLILDLDETLIHATEKMLHREPDFSVFNYNIYKRPHLELFLDEVANHFHLAVWSSASDDYVEEIVKRIFKEPAALKFVWGRSRCTFTRNLADEETGYPDPFNHYHYVKKLKKVKDKGFAPFEKMLIVDDTPKKVSNSYGNALYINEFNGGDHDEELRFLLEYLLSIKDAENVRSIEKRGWRKS